MSRANCGDAAVVSFFVSDGGVSSRVETLTVLFTDLVGSTEHRSRLGEEGERTRLRYAHDALVASAIEGGGGTIIKSTGDGVMATFQARPTRWVPRWRCSRPSMITTAAMTGRDSR